MNNLTNSQKWVIVAFIATALTLGATFFLAAAVAIAIKRGIIRNDRDG
jgi:hypothetical protein